MNSSLAAPNSSKKLKAITHAEFGMYIGLASFAMLFGTLLLSYGLARLRMPLWPPVGMEPLPKVLPTVSTFLLLVSSVFVHEANKAYRQELKGAFLRNWNFACALGLGFLISQLLLWNQVSSVGTKLDSGLFGGIFYTLTGMHAIHILGGLIALAWVAIAARKEGFFEFRLKRPSQAPRLAGMYWHFMDLIWVVMFVLLFWI